MPSYKPCRDCGTRIKSTATRCQACHLENLRRTQPRQASSNDHKYDKCQCGAEKLKTSKRCWECTFGGSDKRPRPVMRVMDVIRTIDSGRAASWRPAHYPPPCPECNGFGYKRYSERDNHTACRDCKGSGHAIPLETHIRNYVGAAHA